MVLVCYGVLFAFLISLLAAWIAGVLELEGTGKSVNGHLFRSIVLLLLVVPLLEVLLFQYLPLKWAARFKKPPYVWVIALASLLYGVTQLPSPLHVIIMCLMGLYLSMLCLVGLRKKHSPILYAWLILACYNGIKMGVSALLTFVGGWS